MNNIRKIFSWLLVLAILLACLPQFTLSASAAETSGECGDNARWNFDASTGTLTISGTGYVRTGMRQWSPHMEQIKSVVVKPGITEISSNAFLGAKNLKSVSLPDTLTSLSDMVFGGCTSLQSIKLPDSITNMGGGVFDGCTSLTSLTFPAKLDTVWAGMLRGCTSLTSVTLPPNVKTIMTFAFQDCQKLDSIKLPASLQSIEWDAFLNTGIYNQESNWSGNVLYIGEWAIAGRPDAAEILVREGTKYIADNAFSGNDSLVRVELPDSLTVIGRSVFAGAESLTEVRLPDRLTTIGNYAFGYCTALETLTVPVSVTLIENSAFENCAKLSLTILNPACKINGMDSHFGTALGVPESTVIIGYDDSTAQIYAERFNHPFVSLGRAPFIDVPAGAFYEKAVSWAVDNEITNGTSVGIFSPARTCTRAQTVTFLWRTCGSPEPGTAECPFTDVSYGAYYYKAVMWALESGITEGTTPTTFSPDAPCSRGQVVTFLWRTAGCPGPESTDNPFTDVKEGAFYYKAVLWAVENGITNGTGKTTFSPNTTCTRGQIVTFLYRAID